MKTFIILLIIAMVSSYILLMKYDGELSDGCKLRGGILVKSSNGWACVKEIP